MEATRRNMGTKYAIYRNNLPQQLVAGPVLGYIRATNEYQALRAAIRKTRRTEEFIRVVALSE